MKNYKLILVFFLLFSSLYSQENGGNYEIAVRNCTGFNIEVQLYPISAIFNGNKKYTFFAYKPELENSSGPNYYNYITGTSYYKIGDQRILNVNHNQISNPTAYQGWNGDFIGSNGNSYGNVVYGNYKLIVKNLETERVDSCLINLDYYENTCPPGDLYFYIYPDGYENRFFYRFDRNDGSNLNVEISYNSFDEYTAKSWQPNGPNNQLNARPKNYGNFELVNILPDHNVDYFPLDSRKDCELIYPEENLYFPQNQIYPETGFDERHGILPLNLTIKKKVTTPFNQTLNYPENTKIIIEPSVILAIDKGLTEGNNIDYCGFFINQYKNIINGNPNNNGNDLILKSSISLDTDSLTTFRLVNANSFVENSRVYIRNNCKLILEERSKIECGTYSQVIIEKLSEFSSSINARFILNNNSKAILGANSELVINYGGEIINYGAFITNSQNAKIKINSGGTYEIANNVTNTHIVNNGAKIILEGGKLKIGDNSKLILDGSLSYLQVNSGSTIEFGLNASIEVKNGATLNMNGTNIYGINGNVWESISLENAGNSEISNCIFNNGIKEIEVYNTNTSSACYQKSIHDNIFNISEGPNFGTYAHNVFNFQFYNNKIYSNGTGTGLYVSNDINYFPSIGGGNSNPYSNYSLNIISNNINNATSGIALACYAAELTPFFIKNNIIQGVKAGSGILTRKITGSIENNYINVSNRVFVFTQSSPNILQNSGTSAGNTIYNTASYPQIAPIIVGSESFWVGGQNYLTSFSEDVFRFNLGLAILDYGQNKLFKSNSQSYHLFGDVNAGKRTYYIRNNCFNNFNQPTYDLYNVDEGLDIIPNWNNSSFDCFTTDYGTNWITSNLGYGIIDTTFISFTNSGIQLDSEIILFNLGELNLLNQNYYAAITNFKTLIDNFPQCGYLNSAIYDMYLCYEKLDTSSQQYLRNVLYEDFKTYLENKIFSNNYDYEFVANAFEFIAMCLTNMTEFTQALNGFEFIALYHPDPYIRLLASWDYTEVQELQQGMGGSEIQDMINDKIIEKLFNKQEKQINEDPIKQKVKIAYENKSAEREKSILQNISKSEKSERNIFQTISAKKQIDEIIKNKAISNLFKLRNLDYKTKEKQKIEDFLIISENSKIKIYSEKITNPLNYSLSQNYPNPFNPITKINYSIPKASFVTLKIFDILGREVKTLVNELKNVGFYSIDFNASNLSSGVYFYQIRTEDLTGQKGEFIQAKKMLLLK